MGQAFVVPALRELREEQGTRICSGFSNLKAGPPAKNPDHDDRGFAGLHRKVQSPDAALSARAGVII
jgi:hypothetical protein